MGVEFVCLLFVAQQRALFDIKEDASADEF